MKDMVAMKELEDLVEVTIRWPSEEADLVRLAGEFNRWQPENISGLSFYRKYFSWQPEPMEREEGGGWSRSLRLRPGR